MAQESSDSDHVVDCDVLVIGGGGAGCWAAIRAKELADRVVLVDKAKVSRGSMTTFSAGVMLCPLEGDDLDAWLEEIVERGEYLADQEWTAMFLREHIKRLKDLELWGLPVERDPAGNIVRVPCRGHKVTRPLMYHSKKYIETLREQVLKRGVSIMERIMITDLVTSDGSHPTKGRVVGAVGMHTRTGEFYVFRAKAIIIAAGGVWGKVWGYSCDVITSDSAAMAYRAGAELMGMEFTCTHHNSIWNRNYQAAGLNLMQGNGVKWRNGLGEAFMERYSPDLKDREKLAIVCAAYAKEALEGRAPIYADMRTFPEKTWQRFRRVLPFLMTVFDHAGIDPRKELVENHPDVRVRSECGDGGILINMRCEASLPGLYAAGAATKSPCQGTYSVGGVNIAFNNVSGYIAGENAARYALGSDQLGVDPLQVEEFRERTLQPMKRQIGVKGDKIFEKILRLIVPFDVIMFKHEKRILRTLSQLEELEEEAKALHAQDPHELVIANEARNYLLVCKLHFAAALQRRESRGWLHREDYPYRDDENWLVWLIMNRGENGEPSFRIEPVPLERYPLSPPQRGIIPERVQVILEATKG